MTRVFHVSTRVFHVLTCVLNFAKLLTLLPDELQRCARGQSGVEFRQEFNGHGPRHVTRVFYVSTCVFHVLTCVLNFANY